MNQEAQNFDIIREVNEFEYHYLKNKLNRVTSICIETKIDLKERLDICNKAIYEWKLMHPFLRCQVINKKVDSNNRSYFVNANDSHLRDSFINFKFLNLENSEINKDKDELFNETWKLLTEKELVTPINFFEGALLWRLTFFSLQDNQNEITKMYKYCVLMTINHSICDGLSTHSTLMHLFQIIENIFKNAYKQDASLKVFPGRNFYSTDFKEIFEPDYFKFPKLDMPCFFNKNPENKKEFETNSDFFKEILGKKIKFINGAEYLSLNDLVEISKRNFSKFLIFSYDKEQTETFLKYCKTCNVKVHSCLKTIFSLGWKILNLKYGQNLGTIKFRFPISVRNHLIKKYGPEGLTTISCCINHFYSKFEENFDEIEFGSKKWMEKFWSVVKADNEIFKNMLKNEEHLILRNMERSMVSNELFVHFSLSNYGVLLSQTENELFNLVELNVLASFSSPNSICIPIYIFANTLNNKLNFNLRYNGALIDKNILDSFVEIINEIFYKIIE